MRSAPRRRRRCSTSRSSRRTRSIPQCARAGLLGERRFVMLFHRDVLALSWPPDRRAGAARGPGARAWPRRHRQPQPLGGDRRRRGERRRRRLWGRCASIERLTGAGLAVVAVRHARKGGGQHQRGRSRQLGDRRRLRHPRPAQRRHCAPGGARRDHGAHLRRRAAAAHHRARRGRPLPLRRRRRAPVRRADAQRVHPRPPPSVRRGVCRKPSILAAAQEERLGKSVVQEELREPAATPRRCVALAAQVRPPPVPTATGGAPVPLDLPALKHGAQAGRSAPGASEARRPSLQMPADPTPVLAYLPGPVPLGGRLVGREDEEDSDDDHEGAALTVEWWPTEQPDALRAQRARLSRRARSAKVAASINEFGLRAADRGRRRGRRSSPGTRACWPPSGSASRGAGARRHRPHARAGEGLPPHGQPLGAGDHLGPRAAAARAQRAGRPRVRPRAHRLRARRAGRASWPSRPMGSPTPTRCRRSPRSR